MQTAKSEKTKIRKREFEIKLLSEHAIMPKKAVRGAIGYDLCLPNDFRVPAHTRVAIPLDFAINLPFGIEAKIEPRSGCSLRGIEGYGTRKVIKRKILGIIPVTDIKSGKMYFDADVCVSKIDPNHTDTIHVIIINHDESFLIRKGSRIAQLTFYRTIAPFFKQVDRLTCDNRGGGLGHTGIDGLRSNSNCNSDSSHDKPVGATDCGSDNNPAEGVGNAEDVSNTNVQSVQPAFSVADTEIDQDLTDRGVHV